MPTFYSQLDGIASLSGDIPPGAEELLNKPFLTEDVSGLGHNQILPETAITAVAKTITFTAPVDCTLRNLVGRLMAKTNTDPLNLTNWNFYNNIGTITISGTGPDVGTHTTGLGIPGAIFTANNILRAPQLNYRMDAGDVLTLTLYINITFTTSPIPYNYIITYDEGQDTSVSPTHFVGGTVGPGLVASLTGAVAASGTITVTGATSPGDTITLIGWPDNAGSTSKIGGVLTGQIGGGGSGTNTWATDAGSITLVRDSILAALQDGSNNWSGSDWNFAAVSTNQISVTRSAAGSFGNSDRFLESSTGLTVTGSGTLTGGVAASVSAAAFATPSVSLTLDRLYMASFGGLLGIFPSVYTPSNITVTALNVGGSPLASLGVQQHALAFNDIAVAQFPPTVVPASTTLSLDAQVQYPGATGMYALAGVVT